MTTERNSAPASGIGASATTELEWKNHGTLRAYAQKNNFSIAKKVQASKNSQRPTIYLRDDVNNKVLGYALGKKASEKFDVGTEPNVDNLYVQSASIVDPETSEERDLYIVTAGGSIEWAKAEDF